MSDNLCGPSIPTKGLLSHIDHDRSGQQDRFAARLSNASQGFRSTPAPTRTGDAAFAEFQQRSPDFALVSEALARGNGFVATRSDLAMPGAHFPAQRTHYAPAPVPAILDASWAEDFARMRLQNGPTHSTDPVGYNPQPAFASSSTQPVMRNGSQQFAPDYAAHAPRYASSHLPPPIQQLSSQMQPQSQSQTQPARLPEFEYNNYPLSLARDTNEAIDAAFAAYDNEFEVEMGRWMDVHGPSPRELRGEARRQRPVRVEHNMRDVAVEHPRERAEGSPQTQQEATATDLRQEQAELQQHATRILDITQYDDSDKFRESTFIEMMRRIQTGDVAVEQDELVNTQTGQSLVPRIEIDDEILAQPVPPPSVGGNKWRASA